MTPGLSVALAMVAGLGHPAPMLAVGPFPYSPTGYHGELGTRPVGQWLRPLPGGSPGGSRSQLGRPALTDRHLYLGAAGAQGLFRMERASGALTFTYPSRAPVLAEPRLLPHHVLFSDAAGYTWLYPLGSEEHSWRHFAGAPILSTPLVVGDRVFLHGLDNVVFALSLDDGSLMWRHAHPTDPARGEDLRLYGAPAPVNADGMILVGFHDGRVSALDIESGEVLWDRVVGEGRYPDIIAEPLVVGSDVFAAGFSGPFVAIDMATGEVRWRLDVGVASAPTVDGDIIYVGCTDGVLRAVEQVTGSVVWEWDTGTDGSITSPVLTSGGLLVASSDGTAWLVDKNGERTWTYDDGFMPSGISVAPVVDGRQVFIVTNGGNLVALLVPESEEPAEVLTQPPWTTPFGSAPPPR